MKAIVAHANNRVIGINNELPWDLPGDLDFFKKMTLKTVNVLFGKNTFDSLKGRKLKGRNIHILSRNMNIHDEVSIFRNKSSVLDYAANNELMIAGGEQVYRLFMPFITELYVTKVYKDVNGDAFFPEYEFEFRKVETIFKSLDYEISKWVRIN